MIRPFVNLLRFTVRSSQKAELQFTAD
jgi:hypothetical protein